MDLDSIQQYNKDKALKAEKQKDRKLITDAVNSINKSIDYQTKKASTERKGTYKVKSVDPLASPKDIQEVVNALRQLSKDLTPKEFTPVIHELRKVAIELSKLPKEFPKFLEFPDFPEFPEFPTSTKIDNLSEIKPWLQAVVEAVGSIEVSPIVDVKQPDVNVTQAKVDITPITKGLEKVEKALSSLQIPEVDFSELLESTRKTTKAINSLSFPVPNYVLPFKDEDGKATQAQLIDGSISSPSLDLQVDDTGTYTYLGNATPGTLTSASGWRIKRVVNATGVITHADGVSTFNKEWDERASYSY